ncbi:hypothetical protein VUR80DRAFT_4268 [Thermomyces stellatus]
MICVKWCVVTAPWLRRRTRTPSQPMSSRESRPPRQGLPAVLFKPPSPLPRFLSSPSMTSAFTPRDRDRSPVPVYPAYPSPAFA